MWNILKVNNKEISHGVLIINFEHIPQLFLVFLLLALQGVFQSASPLTK